jgi:hypothetical protein
MRSGPRFIELLSFLILVLLVLAIVAAYAGLRIVPLHRGSG